MLRLLALTVLLSLLPACKSARDGMDQRAFRWFGSTVFSNPTQVKMKEIHLDSGTLLGSEIVIEGAVVKLGEFSTHLIISDETARMLVVLTELVNSPELSAKKSPQLLRVLGTVERGKKGLPFVMAKSLNAMPATKTKG
jgi:hypothetical protein